MKQAGIGILVGLLVAGTMALAYFAGVRSGKRHAQQITVLQTDTVTVVRIDSVLVPFPVAKVVRVRDTIIERVTDTLLQEVAVQLPIEEREYRDTLYRAVVSGYRPSLDIIEVYPRTKTQYITETVQVEDRRRWGLSVTAGAGPMIMPDGSVRLAAGVILGISYSPVTW